jgi:serine/threonine protein kinase
MEIDTRVDELVDRWEELHEQGTPPTIEELCADCPELVVEVRRRIDALRAVDSALDTEVHAPRTTPGGRGRVGAGSDHGLDVVARATAVYTPQRRHARGGLGVVYTAHQGELDRTVALKRIRPDRLHETARRRFLREAVLTARLQHPGIVPIYGLGQDEAGPFYTMPFIRGRTLQEAIEAFHGEESLRHDPGRRSLKLRGLLQQFVTACNTVAYAHDQQVVHRDLKPSNIMLGPYGETLVLDWGLAKRFGGAEAAPEPGGEAASPSPAPEDLTATGAVLGTPQYMSPEQARGEPVGPAGDIFSLGLVLNAILTGKSAFDESSFRGVDPLKAVREAAIVPPRRRDARLPRALEAICLKALAARAADRYPTARALAEDLTRWLGDEPVSAWREPISVWARRWARRHRTAVATVVVALVAGVVGLGAVVDVQARANDRLRKAHAETEAALARSEESRQQAEAVSTFLVEAFRSPDPEQDGRQVKVADVLDRASERIEKEFAGSQATQGALLNALGRTYKGLGLYDRAVTLLMKAAEVREAVLGPDHRDALASRHNLASAYYYAGRLPEAIALFEALLKLREARWGPDHPDTLASRSGLALAYEAAARTAEAIALSKAMLKLREAKFGPDHPDTLTSRNNLAISLATSGRLSEAIELFEETLKRRGAVLGPGHPDTLTSRNNLAAAYSEAGRQAEAILLHEETLKLYEAKLGPEHPDTLRSRDNLATAYSEADRLPEAIALYEPTLQSYEDKLGPDHPDTLRCCNNLATAYRQAGRTGDAIALHEATLKRMEDKLGPDHDKSLTSRHNLAAAYESLDRWGEAEGLLREVQARRRKAVPSDSPLLARELASLGRNLLRQSRWSEAEPFVREAVTIREKATPDDWQRYYVMSLLGEALLGQGRYGEAEPMVVAGYEGMKARAARITTAWGRSYLPLAAEQVVQLYEDWGQAEKAAAWKAKLGMPDLPAEVFAAP